MAVAVLALTLTLPLLPLDPILVHPHDDPARDPVTDTAAPPPVPATPPPVSTAPGAPVDAPGHARPSSSKPQRSKSVPSSKPTAAKRFRQHRLADDMRPDEGTPLALAFDGGHIALDDNSLGLFAFEPGVRAASAWPKASTPWLVRDLDGDGRITTGRELFGSFTMLAGGGRAKNGFVALAALDENGDGVVDARDPKFATLALWRDDGDRVVDPGELQTLAAAGVVALRLDYVDEAVCDPHGDCERERAAFTWVDEAGRHEGATVDVHLRIRRAGGFHR